MDYDKLIEQLKGISNGLAEDEFPKCASVVKKAATALLTLQAENEKLRAELEQVKRERHGRWFFKYPNGWACSRCGEWGLMIDNRGIYKSSYCPNCGARMDKEDEHEAG